jgi:hypothetical protein
MSITIKKPLPSAQTVIAGSTAKFDLSVGNIRYHKLLLRLTNGMGSLTAVSDIVDELRVLVDGRLVRFSSYDNANDPILRLYFAEPWRRNAGQEDVLAWGMSDVSNFQIEVDIKAGSTNLDFTGFAEVDFVKAPLGDVIHVMQTKVPATAAGTFNLTTLPKNLPYLRLHSFSSDIDELKIIRNNETVFEVEKAELIADQTMDALNPDANHFTVAFDQRQRIEDYLEVRGASQFELEYTLSGTPTSFDLVYEQLGPVLR